MNRLSILAHLWLSVSFRFQRTALWGPHTLGFTLCFGLILFSLPAGGIRAETTSGVQQDSKSADSSPVTIRIQSHEMRAEPNAVDTISITISSRTIGIAGFDFTLAYDRETFDLIDALPGDFPDSCNWEYFIGRNNPKCSDPCPNGLFKVVALARFKDLDSVEACLYPASGAELVKLILRRKPASNRKTFLGTPSEPLRFFWLDCGDNSVSSVSGNDLYLAQSVIDADGAPPAENVFVRFPNYTGPTATCFDNGGANAPKAQLKFVNSLIVTPQVELVPATDTTRDSL